MAADTHTNVLFGLYNDEEELIHAVESATESGLDIMDVFTPFPLHGLDPVMGLKESRLHIAGFVYGALGTCTAFGVMTWVFTRNWPIIFGGKPYFSVPAFMPITFELTVLFACVGMVITFYTICGLGPGVSNPILDKRITDDKFCLAFNTNNLAEGEIDNLRSFFNSTQAAEVHSKVI